MLAAIRRFFSTPVFPGDEEKTIAAAMAHYGILFGLVANIIHVPMLILAGDSTARSLFLSSTMIAGLLLNHLFLQRGYVRSSSAVFVVVAWVVLAGANFTAGGVSAPGFAIHVVFVICVGFIFGGRWAFFAAGCSTLLGVLFMILEQRGSLPPLQVNNTPARHIIIQSATLFTVAAILAIMVNRMLAIIAAGRRELLVRQDTERRLERYQSDLEETVRVRTETLAQTNDALRREVDERRRAEEALRQEKDFIARLMETNPAGVLVVDATGTFTFANASAERVLRRPRTEIAELGCASAEWGFTDYQGRPLTADELPFLSALATGMPVRNAPLAVQLPEGTRVLLTVNVAPFGEDRERPRRCVATIEDVTERERLEQEVFRAQKLESVGVLAGGIAHDFNNLLTGIMGNISLAQLDAPAGSQIAEALEEAEKASLQARDLTRQLLTFSRGGAPIKRAVAIAESVTHAVQLALRGSNVRGVFTIPPDLWAVEADQGQINQVFHNLGINACQAMPAGGTVGVEAANVLLGDDGAIPLPAGRYVRVTVVDQGVGIPSGNLERIFDPFFTTKKEGTGLGLAVVYSIVKNHGGHIGVMSAEGQGTTFTVHIPATAKESHPTAIPATVYAGRGLLLVMDDEPAVRSVASRILAAMGYEVHTAADGAEALAAYRDARAGGHAYDAVILDLTIPGGMGGAETLRSLRGIDPTVKAVVSSGYSDDPVMSRYLDYGFCGCIAKPYRSSDLSRVMREVCGHDGDG
jgi:signal transduction histidine kinase/ActR/RegA family two-component response regulator